MPWCPKCRMEYKDGFNKCSDCECDLVEELEELKYENEVLLVSIGDDTEASIIESLLTAYNIPYTKRYRESGNYMEVYMGMTNFGIDIFVPESVLENAKEILNNKAEDDELKLSSEEEQEFEEASREYEKSRVIKGWMLIFFFIILPVVIVLAMGFVVSYFMNR